MRDATTMRIDEESIPVAVRKPSTPAMDRVIRVTALGLMAATLVALVFQSGSVTIETSFFIKDAIWLLVAAALLLASTMVPIISPSRARAMVALSKTRWSGAAIAAGVALVALVGARLVCQNYAMTLDEAMVQFDAAIFRQGQFLARVPEVWRPYTDALETRFILPISGHAAWVSAYLPVNAAIRALLDAIPGFELASAVLGGVAILAIGGVARRLWPDRPDAALVAMILLATSTQFLVTTFTPYAMTAHLALNLVWLWFFLRKDRIGHIGAIVVAALACGIHQIIFHPLFAMPFIIQLWAGRRWRSAALYTAAYAAIGMFWILYWQLVLIHYGLTGSGAVDHGPATFVNQVLDLVRAFSWSGFDLMVKNLTRFLAWQNPLTLPLAIIAIVTMRRFDGPLAALAAGIVLTVVAMFVLLPYQGLGWGYRYLHGFLGSFCLLAAWGWVVVTRAAPGDMARATTRLALCSLFAVAVMLPGRALEVRAFVVPFAEAERAIKAATTDIVLVDTIGMGFSLDLIRNDPFLRNRPLILGIDNLTTSQVADLCASYSVTLFDRYVGAPFHIPPAVLLPESPGRAALRTLGCGVSQDGGKPSHLP